MKIRLDKFLGKAGLGSRREIKNLIRMRSVKVNGKIVTDPAFKVDPEKDHVLVKDVPVKYQEFFYYKMYKPKGVITSTKDKDKTIIDLLPQNLSGLREIFPAGRLDKDAEGLLILTNDGELAHRITHPRWKLEKVYEVLLDKSLTLEDKKAIEEGLELKEGKTLPANIEILHPEAKEVLIKVREGRYHLIKRLFGKLGYKVLNLKRIAIGPITLGNLKPGEFKKLTKKELKLLKSLLGLGESNYQS